MKTRKVSFAMRMTIQRQHCFHGTLANQQVGLGKTISESATPTGVIEIAAVTGPGCAPPVSWTDHCSSGWTASVRTHT